MADGTPIIIKKKKGHGGHGHHGGSWKVAYADFVTAMMAFFMVMWIMGLSEETKAKIQTYFQDPFAPIKVAPKSNNKLSITPMTPPKPGQGSGEGKSAHDKESDELAELQKKINKEVSGDPALKALFKHLDTEITKDGLRVEMVESTDAEFFKTGSAQLSESAHHLVARIAPLLKQAGHPIIIEGHTDSRPYKSVTYNNWDLSSDRANTLRRALMQSGIDGHYFRGIRALADTELKYPLQPLDPRNRRVTLLLPFQAPKDATVEMPRQELENQLRQELQPGVAPSKLQNVPAGSGTASESPKSETSNSKVQTSTKQPANKPNQTQKTANSGH